MEVDFQNLVKLDKVDLKHLMEGRLVYVTHSKFGTRKTDFENVYVNSLELSEDEKEIFKKYD